MYPGASCPESRDRDLTDLLAERHGRRPAGGRELRPARRGRRRPVIAAGVIVGPTPTPTTSATSAAAEGREPPLSGRA
jgi:hypothetical protein